MGPTDIARIRTIKDRSILAIFHNPPKLQEERKLKYASIFPQERGTAGLPCPPVAILDY